MGGFYGSVQVRCEDREKVREAAEQVAKARGIKCLLGPVLGGWVGVYPENNGQDQAVGLEIAQRLGCDVLHVLVHDDDVLAYWFWRGGKEVDSYWSLPGYFGEEGREEQEAMIGHPEIFGDLLRGGPEPMRELLRRDRDDFVFAMERLQQFATLLGIANAVTAYEYLKAGETDGIRGWMKFEELPAADVARQRQAAKEERRQVTALKRRLRDCGVLLLEVVAKNRQATSRVCSLKNGLALAWLSYRDAIGLPPLEFYSSPWKEAAIVPLDTATRVHSLARDSAGQRLAAALDDRVVVWATEDWGVIREIRAPKGAAAVALSAQGRRLAYASREDIMVAEVDTGAQVSFPPLRNSAREMFFHPSGQYLTATQFHTSVTSLLDTQAESPWRELKVGDRQTVSLQSVVQHLKAIEPEEVERKLRSKMETDLQQHADSLIKGYGRDEAEKVVQRMWAQMEEHVQKSLNELLALRSGPTTREHLVSESPLSLRFTDDGKWLCCGTDKGFRVYPWPEVVATTGEDMPRPTWRHDTIEPDKYGMLKGHIYAIAQEVDGAGVVFGGLTGRLFRMDLNTGEVRCLLTMPEDAVISDLAISGDGQALGIVSTPNWSRDEKARGDQRVFWSVWSYPKLLAGSGDFGSNMPRANS